MPKLHVRYRYQSRPGGGIKPVLMSELPQFVLGGSAFMRFNPLANQTPGQPGVIEGGLETYEVPLRVSSGDLVYNNPSATDTITFVVPLLRNTVNVRFINLVGAYAISINNCPSQTGLNGDSLLGWQLSALVLALGPLSSIIVQLGGT